MIKQLQCPNCAARLRPVPGQPLATCAYCGTTSQIGPPDQATRPQQPVQQPGQPTYPVAYYQSPKWIWAVYVVPFALMMLVSGGVAVFHSVKAQKRVQTAVAKPPAPPDQQAAAETNAAAAGQGPKPRWSSNRLPMLANVNGDGADDIVGWVNLAQEGGEVQAHLAAFELGSGRRLWMTPAIAGLSDSYKARAAVAGSVVLVAGAGGSAQAFSLGDGSAAWRVPLGERAVSICRTGDDAAVIETKDEKRHRVQLSDGALSPAKKGDRCVPTWTDGSAPGHRLTYRDRTIGDVCNLRPEGMSVGHVLSVPERKLLLLLGHKDPGTRIPMAALYRCDKLEIGHGFHYSVIGQLKYRCRGAEELWKGTVPEGDPLSAKEGRPEVAAIGAGRVYVGYESENPHLAAFELESGRRLWDWTSDSDGPGTYLEFAVPAGDYVMVSRSSGAPYVLEAKSGHVVTRIGH